MTITNRRGLGRATRISESGTFERAKTLRAPLDRRARLERACREAQHSATGLARLQAASAALGDAWDVADVANLTLEHGRAALGARYAIFAVVTEDGAALDLRFAGLPGEPVAEGARIPLRARTPLTEAARSGSPVFLESIDGATCAPEMAALVRTTRARACAVVPLTAGDRALGVLALCFSAARAFGPEDRALLSSLGEQAGHALDRARRHGVETKERVLAAFLADAASDLAASLDTTETLERAVHLVVPFLADACALVLAGDVGTERVVVAHSDPSLERAFAEHVTRAAMDLPGVPLLERVRRTGEPLVVSAADATELGGPLLDWPGLSPFTSCMVVPLLARAAHARARGGVLGTVAFVSSTSARRYDASDLALARNLAQRAAIAIDNARLYERAQAAIRARDEILAVVSHDLRNPLSVVRAVTHTMRRTLGGERSPRVNEHCDVLARSAARMSGLIDDLVDFAQIESGHLSLDRAPHDLCDVVEEALRAHEPLCAAKQIALEADLPRGACPALLDRPRILQVLENLIGNAIKFSRHRGRIVVHLELRAEEARVAVRDDGPGIDPEHLPHVFERYFQAKSTARLGSGLGLAIVKGIVLEHGGRVTAASKLGQGATFTVTLPVARIRTAPAAVDGSAPPQ